MPTKAIDGDAMRLDLGFDGVGRRGRSSSAVRFIELVRGAIDDIGDAEFEVEKEG